MPPKGAKKAAATSAPVESKESKKTVGTEKKAAKKSTTNTKQPSKSQTDNATAAAAAPTTRRVTRSSPALQPTPTTSATPAPPTLPSVSETTNTASTTTSESKGTFAMPAPVDAKKRKAEAVLAAKQLHEKKMKAAAASAKLVASDTDYSSSSDMDSHTDDSEDFSDLSDVEDEKSHGPALTPDQIQQLTSMAATQSTKAKAKLRHIKLDEAVDADRGVIYLGHIPWGFFEDEMKGFFSQFGGVTRIRLARSKRSGRSKGYGFLEFQHKEVAEVVAETMNNYPLFGHTLVCQVVPSDKVHVETFVGANRAFRKIPWRKIAKTQHNKTRTVEQQAKRVNRLLAVEKKRREKLEQLGIGYSFKGYAADQKPKPTHKILD